MLARDCYAAFGIVDAVHHTASRDRGQLLNRPAATASDIQDLEATLDRRVSQTPVGHVFGMYAAHQGATAVRAEFSSPTPGAAVPWKTLAEKVLGEPIYKRIERAGLRRAARDP